MAEPPEFVSSLRIKETGETYRMADWQVKALADLAKRRKRGTVTATTAEPKRLRRLFPVPDPDDGA